MPPLMLIVSNTLVRYQGDEPYVTIPEGITEIQASAFCGCKQLKGITIPQGVTAIGRDAFRDCTSLEHVTIPRTVRMVGDHAFCGCHALQSATFERYIDLEGRRSPEWLQEHDIITEVGRCVFYGCGQLRSIIVARETGNLGSGEIGKVIDQLVDEVDAKEYHFTDKDIVRIRLRPIHEQEPSLHVLIPKGQTRIKACAFKGSDLTGITLPDGLTSIEGRAFWFCTKLEAITLPDSVSYIGPGAFEMCTALTSINVPRGVHNIYDATFWHCGALRSISLPRGVRKIESCAFERCLSLEHVELPEGLQMIERYAFAETGLRSLHIPATVNSIGKWKGVDSHALPAETFSCPWLEQISVDEGNRFFDSRGNCNALIKTRSNVLVLGCSNTIIPDGVTAIGKMSFCERRGLRSIKIPDSVTCIDCAAFRDCTDLEHVTFGKGLRVIGDAAFSGCTKLSSIVLPDGLQELKEHCFAHCSSLKSVRIPESVTHIDKRAFEDCASLEYVRIGNLLQKL